MLISVKNTKTSLQCMTLLCLFSISGCAVLPNNLDSQGQDDGNAFARTIVVDSVQKITSDALIEKINTNVNNTMNNIKDSNKPILSRGDIIRLNIYGMDEFDGLYQVDSSGEIDIPFTDAITAAGKNKQQLEQSIENELVALQWFHKDTVNVSVSITELAPVNVNVSGAVFNPGQVSINNKPMNMPAQTINNLAGTFSADRSTSSALRAAGGVRPDADLSRVILKRGNTISLINMVSIISGDSSTSTPYLMQDDQIIVLSTGNENETLIKPSQITPPGMRIFVSNLTKAALSKTIGDDPARLPYGSSLLDSAISSNCVGGTQAAGASRSVVLITKNYGSNEQIVVNRSIDQLLANASDKKVNPYLMPNDALACYDSRFTNFREVARGLSELFSPFLFWSVL